MLLNILRVFFVMVFVAVMMRIADEVYEVVPAYLLLLVAFGVVAAVFGIDLLIPHKSLLAISGVFFGLLVGMLVAYGLSLVLDLFVDAYREYLIGPDGVLSLTSDQFNTIVSICKVAVGVICCYLAVSFILQTKDDVRFVIPYVEFVKQRKGQHPIILDTSAIIDGRISDVLQAWLVDAPVIIPRFVLHELQAIADSGDKLKRNRGRRGLDMVNRLQGMEKLDVKLQDTRDEPGEDVDHRLVSLAGRIDGRIVTSDYNLSKVAQIRGIEVININALANALKPLFMPGESMHLKIFRPGEERGQGVGYLDDGTMVVVEGGREHINNMVQIVVTSVLQTSAGRMVFGRTESAVPPDRVRRRPADSASASD